MTLTLKNVYINNNGYCRLITEKYRPEPGIEPRTSRLTYERTSDLPLSYPDPYNSANLGFFPITLVSCRVCGVPP